MFIFRKISNILLALLFSSPIYADGIIIEEAWIREAPPISQVQAGYAIINNNRNHDVKLIAASSPAFGKIEFHKTVLENGLSKMIHQPSITILSKNHVILKPEGMHMMLFNPVKPLRAGEKVNVTFQFNDGKASSISFIVKKTLGANTHQHNHH